MNDTNNNNIGGTMPNNAVDSTQTPPVTQTPSPVPTPVQPASLVAASPAPTSAPAGVEQVESTQTPSPVSASNTSEVKAESNNSEEEVGKREFPFSAVIIAIILIIIAVLYYVFYLSPTRLLDGAINDIFNSIKDAANGITNPDSDTMFIALNGKLRTVGSEYENMKDIAFLDNLKVSVDIEADLKKLDFGTTIKSDVKDTKGMKYPENVNMAVDYIDNNFYLEFGDIVAKYDATNNLGNKLNFDYDRINSAVSLFEIVKDQVLDIIQEEKLTKTIATKKINNQTAIAVKASTKLNNDEIAAIYNEGFKNLSKDKEAIKYWSKTFAVSEKEAVEEIERILSRTVQTQNIEVNLYMNLANTQLIGFDVTVDNYYVEINSLNGFYFIDIKYIENGFDVLDITVEYDSYHGVLNGVGILDVKSGYLKVLFDYTRIEAENSNTMVGNTLDFKFFDDEEDTKPIVTLDCTLDLEYDKDIELADTSKAVNLIELSDKEINKVLTVTDKLIYESLFVVKKLALNNLPAQAVESVVNQYTLQARDMVEKEVVNMIDAYLRGLPPKQLAAMLSSPEASGAMLKKISVLSKENQQEVMKIIAKYKTQLTSGTVNKSETVKPEEKEPTVPKEDTTATKSE